MSQLTVGVFNDSFPPTIDGVANVTLNYAREIARLDGTPIVATPWYPKVSDQYPFEVVRYPSAYVSGRLGYRAGYPFDPRILYRLSKSNMDIIHTHCPFISTVLARTLRFQTSVPVVFTYHTKFDIDIDKVLALNPARNASIKFLLNNIHACDEVWTVSKGAGENLRSLGYTGDYCVMPNGTDFKRGKASESDIASLRRQYALPPELPVFLYVGRMMWYKGIRLTLDGLRILKSLGRDFCMFFIGGGIDLPEIKEYAREAGLEPNCIFTGPLYDREILRTYFSMADLFLFPSTYDTNGIVVNEAAACSCPSLLIAGSCAAERVKDKETGLVIEEDPAALASAILWGLENRDPLKKIGENASQSVYLHWGDAVKAAYERYGTIVEGFTPGKDLNYPAYIFFEEVQHIKEDFAQKKASLKHYYAKKRKGLRAIPFKRVLPRKLMAFPLKEVLRTLGWRK